MSTKRFYKDVSVARDGDAFAIHLDGRPVRTPGRLVLALPHEEMVELVATEWREQGETIEPKSMPITRLTQGALDRGEDDRERIVESIVEYAGSDLLCYRAETPPELQALQAENWDPLLNWAKDILDIKLDTTEGINAVEQPAASLERVRAILDDQDEFGLAGLQAAVPLLGSAVLGLALFHGYLDADEAHARSLVDELWQEAQWGLDEEAAARRAFIRDDLEAIERYFRCLRDASA